VAWYWIFNMGRSAKAGDKLPHQQMWVWNNPGQPNWETMPDGTGGLRPADKIYWLKTPSSDPAGSTGGLPSDFVGAYGNWWGVTNSGGRYIGEHGIGPVDVAYIDALDEIARDHDICCYLAVEASQSNHLAVNDIVRVEHVWLGSRYGPKYYSVTAEIGAHMMARERAKALPQNLRKKLEHILQKSPIKALILGYHEPVPTCRGSSPMASVQGPTDLSQWNQRSMGVTPGARGRNA
jgi:hypothetical protein